MLAVLYRWAYSLLLYLFIPFELLRLKSRGRKAPDYNKRWSERFAFGLKKLPWQEGGIWVHTVSVGETIAAIPIIKALQASNPELSILVTTMTPTGSERVRASLKDTVTHCYAPYDLPDAVGRFLRSFKPSQLLIMETELWPNIINGCYQRGIPIGLMNARLSQKSAAGYAKFSRLTESMLDKLTFIAAQDSADAERFISLGADKAKTHVTGNVKFDIEISNDVLDAGEKLRESMPAPFVWVAGSTHEGEETILLEAHKKLLEKVPEAQLILVPRHPERFDAVFKLIQSTGLAVSRRSLAEAPSRTVYLADTMGELLISYSAGDVAFVGGSLIERGGHNMLEPAALEKALLLGPSNFNFAHIASKLTEQGGAVIAGSADELYQQLLEWQDGEKRQVVASKAVIVVTENRGALSKLIRLIEG